MISRNPPGFMKNLVLFAATSALAIFVCEVALRLLMPELVMSSSYRRARAEIEEDFYYVWEPGSRRILHPSPLHVPGVNGPSSFSVNRQGIRGQELEEFEYRILAVGGSTTECLYLDDAETWTALVETELARTSDGRDVWVGNAGKSGMNLRDHVVLLETLLERHPPVQMIILLAGVNDLTVRLRDGDFERSLPPLEERSEWDLRIKRNFALAPDRNVHGAMTGTGVAETWLSRLAIYGAYRSARRNVRQLLSERGLVQGDDGGIYQSWREARSKATVVLDAMPSLRLALADYRKHLLQAVEIASRHSIQLVLVTQPALWRDDLDKAEQKLLWLGGVGDFQRERIETYYSASALADGLEAFNGITRAVCDERGLKCIDLAASIPREVEYFYDDVHFTEAGSQAVSRNIVHELQKIRPFLVPES